MWDKPDQITACWGAHQYTGYGFEIAYGELQFEQSSAFLPIFQADLSCC